MNQFEINCCHQTDPEYPVAFRSLKGMPTQIYYRGNAALMNSKKCIAIIGSRQTSDAGRYYAYEAGKIAAENQLCVVNGLALGCDSEAIKGALSADGQCIAIMPCGLEQIQPKTNQKLADEILSTGGCLLSEYPVGMPLKKYMYVERDRLQSAVSQGVLIIEASAGSGTMHTADFAQRQYRRLACYASHLLKATGNQALEQTSNVNVLHSSNDLVPFLEQLKNDITCEQMTLDFHVTI